MQTKDVRFCIKDASSSACWWTGTGEQSWVLVRSVEATRCRFSRMMQFLIFNFLLSRYSSLTYSLSRTPPQVRHTPQGTSGGAVFLHGAHGRAQSTPEYLSIDSTNVCSRQKATLSDTCKLAGPVWSSKILHVELLPPPRRNSGFVGALSHENGFCIFIDVNPRFLFRQPAPAPLQGTALVAREHPRTAFLRPLLADPYSLFFAKYSTRWFAQVFICRNLHPIQGTRITHTVRPRKHSTSRFFTHRKFA